jgi:hypothetical protein
LLFNCAIARSTATTQFGAFFNSKTPGDHIFFPKTVTNAPSLLKMGALVIVLPDRFERRAKAGGIPLPDGRGSVASGETMTEAVIENVEYNHL